MCNGDGHALRAERGLIEDQRRVIVGLRNKLRQHRVPFSLDPSLATAAITGIDNTGLNPRKLDLKYPSCRLIRSAVTRRYITWLDSEFPGVVSSDRLDLAVVEWCFFKRSPFCTDGLCF